MKFVASFHIHPRYNKTIYLAINSVNIDRWLVVKIIKFLRKYITCLIRLRKLEEELRGWLNPAFLILGSFSGKGLTSVLKNNILKSAILTAYSKKQ